MSRRFFQRKRTWIAVAILAGAALAAPHRAEIAAALERLDWNDVQTAVRAAGCTLGQGYYFSRPVPAAEFTLLLKQGRKLTDLA